MIRIEDLFILFQKRKYTQTQRFIFNVIVIPLLFFIILPAVSYILSREIEVRVNLPSILIYPANIFVGIILLIIGLFLFFWSVWTLYQVGKGTPSPVMPTQKLVAAGPYVYSRNPMVLGEFLWIGGLGIVVNSIPFTIIGLSVPIVYLIYIKIIEEKELEARFGKQYFEYKKKVPFIIPRFK